MTLTELATRDPVCDYLNDRPRANQPEATPPINPAQSCVPLVSIVVRSMGREELRFALESLAVQDYPSLEVIVVDATGGRHPPLPKIAWRTGHQVRIVDAGRPLSRPQAANVGLDAVKGEWFGFLDDDDFFDFDHVAVLMALAGRTSNLAVYGMSRVLYPNGEVKSLVGQPFNRSLLLHGPLCTFAAALFCRKVIQLSCRFDERMEVFEDQDFFIQVSEHSDFSRSERATFNYRIELGTSGTGCGANSDPVRSPLVEHLLRAKWAGLANYHRFRTVNAIQCAMNAYARNDSEAALAIYRDVLREYPEDPNALNGMAHIWLSIGDLNKAEPASRRAIEINPSAGEYRLTLAMIEERLGNFEAARDQAWQATADARARTVAQHFLAQLGGPPSSLSNPRMTPATSISPLRTGPCPCGSGKRYKHCCGSMAAPATKASSVATNIEAERAIAELRSGEAIRAIDRLMRVSPFEITNALTAAACGELLLEMGCCERAVDYCRRVAQLGNKQKAVEITRRLGDLLYLPEREASQRQMLRKLLARHDWQSTPAPISKGVPLHIIAPLGKRGGTEIRALHLYEALAPLTQVRLWSTEPPLPEYGEGGRIEVVDASSHPQSGHFIFLGTHYDYGNWLAQSQPSHITLRVNTRHLEGLMARLIQLEAITTRFSLGLAYPSTTFRAAVDLPGRVQYSPVDTEIFRSKRNRQGICGGLTIGRHSRDDRLSFHPNDPSFFRRLVKEGHRIEIVGGTCLSEALASDLAASEITLRPVQTQSKLVDLLDSLDCFIYRVHPHCYETGGTAILEAMSMALPVIVFDERVGVAELIEHGRNGYLVKSEEEALVCLRVLAADPALRCRIGVAARATIFATMAAQRQSLHDELSSR